MNNQQLSERGVKVAKHLHQVIRHEHHNKSILHYIDNIEGDISSKTIIVTTKQRTNKKYKTQLEGIFQFAMIEDRPGTAPFENIKII